MSLFSVDYKIATKAIAEIKEGKNVCKIKVCLIFETLKYINKYNIPDLPHSLTLKLVFYSLFETL